ncbi:MAG: methyltransferase domain-containing protein, partial [Syntrophobacteraceae bacterium]
MKFVGERIVPGAPECEPTFADKMYQEHITRYMFAAQLILGKSVLDIGCGVGYGSQYLALNGADRVVAFDIDPETVEYARENYGAKNLEYRMDSAESFSFIEKFDIITCFEVIEHLEEQERLLRCIKKALKKKGFLIVSTPRPFGQMRSPFHVKEVKFEEFYALLRTQFRFVEFFSQNNHFASLISSGSLTSIEPALAANCHLGLPLSDYFIAVASDETIPLEKLQPRLSITGDSYILTLEKDNRTLQGHYAGAEAEKQSISVRIATLGAEKEALETKISTLGWEKQTLGEQVSLLAAEKEALETRVSTLESEKQTLGDQVSLLETEKQALAKSVSRLETEGQSLADRISALEVEKQSAVGRISLMETEKQVFAEQIAKKEAENHSLSSRVAVLKVVKQGFVEQISTLDNEKQDLAGQISVLINSRSWRITRPMRAVWTFAEKAASMLKRRRSSPGCLPPMTAARHDVSTDVSGGANLRASVNEGPDGRAPGLPGVEAYVSEDTKEYIRADTRLDVLYIIGCFDGESKRYRVFNQMEVLRSAGYSAAAFLEPELDNIRAHRITAGNVVIFRAADGPQWKSFLPYVRSAGASVIFDVDDLVFDPEMISYHRAFGDIPPEEKKCYMRGVHGYRKLLLKSDICTVPTPYLAAKVEELGKPAAIVPNTLNKAQLNLAEQVLDCNSQNGTVNIGYFSGSKTHDVDFLACEASLQKVMAAYPECRLTIGGYLDLSPSWSEFDDRIDRLPFMNYLSQLSALASLDINLAPLETANPFCECKSQLKIFEAGAVGIPTVATYNSSFAAAILDGEDGLLARNEEDWFQHLEKLVSSREKRAQIGERARRRALKQFSPDALLEKLRAVYALDPKSACEQTQPQAAGRSSGRLNISWILPGIIIGGGGHRNILRAAYHLGLMGHQVNIYVTGTTSSDAELAETIKTHFYPISSPVYRYGGRIEPADALFATHYSTVAVALAHADRIKELMYFVQDYEPLFMPMSSEYIRAENTYRQGLYHITSGPWCAEILRRDFNADADSFQFPIDGSVYYPRPRTKENRNIIFFAKPEMSRRCFELGIDALAAFHLERPDVEIVMFGSNDVRPKMVPFPATIKGLLPTLDDLASMYSNGDLGIVFSPTNPSLVPYEMMACGLPVVDIGRPGAEINYGGRFDIALLADPRPEVMALQMCELLSNA